MIALQDFADVETEGVDIRCIEDFLCLFHKEGENF